MATIEIVHIYMPTQVASTEWIHALSIPREDIERLTHRPLKWLRFATFTVCGAKGDFSATRGGEIIDYENVSFDNLADKYYYTPDNMYHLVDYQAFDDQCTSSAATPRRSAFREEICGRDDHCVITRRQRQRCDAAHIIPKSKSSEYITYVVHDRASLYEQQPISLDGDVDINCIENGMLLRRDLHDAFRASEIEFLKTPNFAMVPADVPRIEQGPIPDNRTTLQYMEPPTGLDSVQQRDVQADRSRDEFPPPPSILLDFMYGVAVANHWMCDRLGDMLAKRFEDDFSKVLAEGPNLTSPEGDEREDEREDESDDSKDESTPGKGKQKERKTFSSDAV